MQNKPNLSKSQIFITSIRIMNYNTKQTLDTWSKQTQTNPICPERSRRIYGERSRTTCSELARPELVEGVESILSTAGGQVRLLSFKAAFLSILKAGYSSVIRRIVEKNGEID
jgi:hypothetical protein